MICNVNDVEKFSVAPLLMFQECEMQFPGTNDKMVLSDELNLKLFLI